MIVVQAKSFEWNAEDNRLSAEASTLGLPPGTIPDTLSVGDYNGTLNFRLYGTISDGDPLDIQGWEYRCLWGKAVLWLTIIND